MTGLKGVDGIYGANGRGAARVSRSGRARVADTETGVEVGNEWNWMINRHGIAAQPHSHRERRGVKEGEERTTELKT
jgi:hypothetical protein